MVFTARVLAPQCSYQCRSLACFGDGECLCEFWRVVCWLAASAVKACLCISTILQNIGQVSCPSAFLLPSLHTSWSPAQIDSHSTAFWPCKFKSQFTRGTGQYILTATIFLDAAFRSSKAVVPQVGKTKKPTDTHRCHQLSSSPRQQRHTNLMGHGKAAKLIAFQAPSPRIMFTLNYSCCGNIHR